ncbi:MAG: DMT family transporter [Casimicrobiaceae bacterium]
MTAAPPHTLIYAKLTGVALVWGGSFIAARVVAVEMPAATAALWRYLIATTALLALSFMLERGLPRLSRAQVMGVSLLGVTGVVLYSLCFMYGMQSVSASRGSLIIATVPAATLLGGALFLHEPLTLRRGAGIAIALFGVAVELGRGNPLALFQGHAGIGEVWLFGCVMAWAAYTLLGRRLLTDLSPLSATTYAALIGTALLVVLCAATGDLVLPAATPSGWGGLVFLGLFGTALAYIWFYDGVRAIGPARTSVFVNLVPIFAITFAVFLLHEPLELSMIVGAVLVVSGVFIINRPERPDAVASAATSR